MTAKPHTIIFDRSWRTGEVPENKRKASVIPVFKKGHKESGNCTPVSLMSLPGKLMEQIVLDVISKKLVENKVIRNIQYGFTKRKSCLTGLVAFYDAMAGWVDEETAVGAVCLDFSMAFDSAFPNIFEHKLRKLSREVD